VHLLDLDAAEEAPLRVVLNATLPTLCAQIFVAKVASERRPSSAAPRDRSAAPYIGDESKTPTPAPNAAFTTSRASDSSSSNVANVPSPTTGPSFRSSTPSR
jgi:hypothetical protein